MEPGHQQANFMSLGASCPYCPQWLSNWVGQGPHEKHTLHVAQLTRLSAHTKRSFAKRYLRCPSGAVLNLPFCLLMVFITF